MPLFPPDRRPTVDVVTLGDVSTRAVATARRTVEETVGVVPETRRGPRPSAVTDPEPVESTDEDQYDASALMEAVADASEADLAVGLTAAPTRYRGRTGLFGLGHVGGEAAIVSTYRFDEDETDWFDEDGTDWFDESSTDRFDGDGTDRFDERVEKQVRKQLGRLFGLETTHEGCVLEAAPFLPSLDGTAADFCADCRARLTDPETAPRPPAWVVLDAPVLAETDAVDADASDDADLDLSLRTLPLLAVGVAVLPLLALARGVARLSAWESTLPSDVRRPIHGSYRIVRFWTAVALFFALASLALFAEFRLYERLFGTEPGLRLFWGMLVVALGLGYVCGRWVRGLVVGAYRLLAYEP